MATIPSWSSTRLARTSDWCTHTRACLHRASTSIPSMACTYPSQDMHTDDSDVTFNICLGRNFTGAALTICGDSRQPTHRQFHMSYAHERGRALVHLGSRRHGADDIRAGERNNLIVWNQNSRYRASAAYVNRQPYLKEIAPPDPRCLSYTHDRDFGHFLDYPPGAQQARTFASMPCPARCCSCLARCCHRRQTGVPWGRVVPAKFCLLRLDGPNTRQQA